MYTKQNFENGQVLSAEQLIKIEDGIIDLSNNFALKTLYVINCTIGEESLNGIYSCSLDKTFEEMQEAYLSNQGIVIICNGDLKISEDGVATEYETIVNEYIPLHRYKGYFQFNKFRKSLLYDEILINIQLTVNSTESQIITSLSTIPTKISELENDSGFLTSIPETLPNPNALTINGNSYDGTKAVDITEQVNTLINLKLEEIGVAEEVVY